MNALESKYESVIGLEVHVELATKTKIFCGCSTKFGAKPNTQTCPVCTGMPGSLPVLNKKVLEYAISVGLATNCEISRYSKFDRKNYFYPDNPQNYQISQLYLPICKNGYVEIDADSLDDSDCAGHKNENDCDTAPKNARKVRIHEIHMEEDAGKLLHDEDGDFSLVDFNRSGVPLIEIVSEPDMRSPKDVIAYLEKLRIIIQYLGASDCKLQEGSMRADVNLSVRRKGDQRLGTRTEMKNLNSFKAITHVIEGEFERQVKILEGGQSVTQETRRWDDNKSRSYPMRSKEDAQDYRYFPDPDLTPILIDEGYLNELRKALPEFRTAKQARYKADYGIPEYDIDILTQNKKMADIFEAASAICKNPKLVSNWLMVGTLQLLKDRGMDPVDIAFSPENLAALVKLIENKTINSNIAKQVFEAIFDEDVDPVKYVKEHGLATVHDDNALLEEARRVIGENPKSVADYKSGKTKAMGFLVGNTMKAMKGKAEPARVNEVIRELLDLM